MNDRAVRFKVNGRNAVKGFLQLLRVGHSGAGHAHRIDLFTAEAMLGEQLVKAVGIARLEENQHAAFGFSRFGDEILGKVRAAEIVPDERGAQLVRIREYARRNVVGEFARLPAQRAVDRAVCKQLGGFGNKRLAVYFLHLRSSNLLFSPSLATV